MKDHITLLDYYAGQALAGIIANPNTHANTPDSTLARVALSMAQTVLEERKKYIKEETPKSNLHVIDCDADPFCPDWLTVEEHKKCGQFTFDASKIKCYLDPVQKTGRIVGNDLRKKLANEPVLNANVLDHLLANTNLIPEGWKFDEQGRTRYIFFWGTIYRRSDGCLCVRYLCWNVGQWLWLYFWLGSDFDDLHPAAISAS